MTPARSPRAATAAALALLACLAAGGPLAARPGTPAPAGAPEVRSVAASQTALLLSLDGETLRVTGVVESAGRSPSGHQFLNFRDSTFVTVTFRTDLARFKDGTPADLYEGKTVAVTGPIKIYKGVPEIVLSEPSLIEVIDPADAVVPPPPPPPAEEKKPEPAPEPEPAEPAPAPPAQEPAAEKPPVDWRLYFPDPKISDPISK